MQASVRVRVRLAAHDFWLAATPWQPETRVTITANIGEIFPVATDRIRPALFLTQTDKREGSTTGERTGASRSSPS